MVSFFVIRRTSEIGIRMAMGASRSSVISMVLRGVLGQILIGIALGIPVALYAVHLFASLLYRISAGNPLTYLSATMALGICATVAGLIPALRAASIDPTRALREE